MIINLVPDSSVASAPTGFVAAIEQAASILESLITNNITINIAYGWGTYNNQTLPELTGADDAVGGYLNGIFEDYSTVKSWLSASASSALDLTAVASLPANDSVFPNPNNQFIVASAEEKALGHISGDPNALDGAIGFGTATDSSFWLGAALHEITHAMGRISGYATATYSDLLDIFRFSGTGTYQWTGGQPAYFSIDGGVTDIANFSTVSDFGDYANDSLTPSDSFDAFVTGSALTQADMSVMDAIGFKIGTALIVSAGQMQTVPAPARLNGAVVLGSGTLLVASGGMTSGTTVEAGGNESVLSGGQASGTVLSSGGTQTVNGGTAVATSILNGGIARVSSGGTASAATVSGGGVLNLSSGGGSRDTTLLTGGQENVSAHGNAHQTIIGSGGVQHVLSGGLADQAHVSAGGRQDIAAGGTASGTTVEGGGIVVAGSGGIARGTTVKAGGTIVYAGGTFVAPTVSSGAFEEIARGAAASRLTIGGGATLFVLSGAIATAVHVLSGGEMVYAGGAMRGVKIDSGGNIGIAPGVTAAGLKIDSGVTLHVSSGATARFGTLAGGLEIVSSGGMVGGPVTFAGNADLVLADTASMTPKLSGFDATDRLDLAGFSFSATQASVTFAGKSRSVLALTDGALAVSITLFGQYVARGFHLSNDGTGGTAITYTTVAASHLDIAGNAAGIMGHGGGR